MCVLLTAIASGVSAQSLGDADAAFESGDIEAARSAYDTALRGGGLTGEDLSRAYLRAGILAFFVGDAEAAGSYVRIALLLEPSTTTPAELTPEAREAVEQIRGELGASPPLALEAAIVDDGGPLRVELRGPPVAGAVLRVRAAGPGVDAPWTVERAASPSVTVELPAEAWGAATQLAVDVSLLDSLGNVMRTTRLTARAPVLTAPASALTSDAAVAATGPEDQTGLWVGIAIAIVAALGAGGAVAGWAIWDAVTPTDWTFVAEALRF